MDKYLQKINLGGINFLAIDLTQELDERIQVFPGDPKPEKQIFSTFAETGYQHYIFKLGDHVFQPHADAPNHQNGHMQDKGIEIFNHQKYIFNSACLIDVSCYQNSEKHCGIRYLQKVTEKELLPWKNSIKKVGAVVVRTGYDKWLENHKKHNPQKIPYLSNDAAEFIASFPNINVFGIDSLTIDAIGNNFAHRMLTQRLLTLESLVHLDRIPIANAENFTLQTKPITIVGATGAPVVAYAYIREPG